MQEEIGQKFYSSYFGKSSSPKIESLSTFAQTLFTSSLYKRLYFYRFSIIILLNK